MDQQREASPNDVIMLFVVILVLVGLALMCLPSGTISRSPSAYTSCQSNLSQIGKAIQFFSEPGGRYPGWRETVGNNDRPWSVAILPYLDHVNCYNEFAGTSAGRDPQQGIPWLPFYVCPSDTTRQITDNLDLHRRDMSYVGNAGLGTSDGPEHKAHGVMLDFSRRNPNRIKVTAADLVDGKTYTVLVSENIANTRYIDLAPFESHPKPYPAPLTKAANVFVWFKGEPPQGSVRRINGHRDLTMPAPPGYSNEDLARPSSYHTNGVNMVFADGHVQFVNENINYNVYRQLMTPDGTTSSNLTGTPNPKVTPSDLQ